jgi:hypothetical protein
MDTDTRRRIRARRVANFHERLSQRRQRSQESLRETFERRYREMEANANREAHENLRRLRWQEDAIWNRQLAQAEEMERNANNRIVDLEHGDIDYRPDASVTASRLRERATRLRQRVAREREQRRTNDLRAGGPTVLFGESDTESIPSVQDLSDTPDVPNLSDAASNSSSSEASSDFEALIRANSQANESQPAVRDVVVRIERFRLIWKSWECLIFISVLATSVSIEQQKKIQLLNKTTFCRTSQQRVDEVSAFVAIQLGRNSRRGELLSENDELNWSQKTIFSEPLIVHNSQVYRKFAEW